MGNLILQPTNSQGNLSISLFEYSLRSSFSANHVWQQSNEFNNLVNGTYYSTVRRKSDGVIVGTATWNIQNPSSVNPFITTMTGTIITIPKSVHGKDVITGYIVRNSDKFLLINPPQILDDETFVLDLGEEMTVKIIIS